MAVGDNEQVVSSLGINKNRVKVLGLMLSNGLVGMAGAIQAQKSWLCRCKYGARNCGNGTSNSCDRTNYF